jgi:hypothetical protein
MLECRTRLSPECLSPHSEDIPNQDAVAVCAARSGRARLTRCGSCLHMRPQRTGEIALAPSRDYGWLRALRVLV